MKKHVLPILFFILTVVVIFKLDKVTDYVADILEQNPKVQILKTNDYTKNYDFNFVKLIEDFRPYSYQDIINIYFNVINSGWEVFTFYCPAEYMECLADTKKISEDQHLLTTINNFTHPFNNFRNIKTSADESGEVVITVTKLYTIEKISKINTFVDKILPTILSEDDMTDEEKIKEIHDYIINNTKYDEAKNENGTSEYESNTAFGVFFEGYGICSGYSDAMAIFLERLDIKNFKVASLTHVWNALFIDNEWYHLDLTWDDPVSPNGKDTLWHKYFLIKSDKFIELDKGEPDHIFEIRFYSELK